ncbi:MAG: DUF4198 domain-containing protein [gamma proteobacterium symbiont of Bathyaustriella thionipta]|nr:DUF4198 domain-containing protein [gamma proteobacterium symbiont of Bathyaustriella thionipta]MCU7950762.1 DUF4198 domain-containing protein [gamma proteobacterium symbiont of Bathyaustriella thionipta]MCU7952758.1 DUF4198 domain-containing protein [gamma proteobacterium symbiont of Bathyaustriella thionipta]MCU7957258.1 DUF4198 domain-containing protein [gamma proteobacterium symbiont of Bathyaustriella thionipta]MCU7968511.1 DUF4198 domain-containing protein [gamma proteobacterium symbion
MRKEKIQQCRLSFKKKLIIVLMTVFGFSQLSYAELLWSPKPAGKPQAQKPNKDQHAQHGHNNRSQEKAFYLQDQDNVTVNYFDPSLMVLSLSSEDNSNKYILPKSGMDNYHALVAERKGDTLHESSLRYVYMRGKPSGYSPDNLISKHKLPLEIVPQPMIREHWRFYSNNKHSFQVLFNEKPLVDTWVILQTSNGSKFDSKTNAEGNVSFVLPDDFKDIKPGRRANKPQEFILRTVHIADDVTYKTNFNSKYSVNPSHWQSNSGGLLALSIGFISGIVIMRRHNKNTPQKTKKKSAMKQSNGSQS